MHIASVFGGCFQGVADGVAVVEEDAYVQGFPFVLAYDVGFDGHAAADDFGADFRFYGQQGGGVFLKGVHQVGVENQAVLDGFGPAFG